MSDGGKIADLEFALSRSEQKIKELKNLIIWMNRSGNIYCQNEYFIKEYERLFDEKMDIYT